MGDENREKDAREAAALQYNPEHDLAPRLVAYGKGEVAQAILQIAKEHDIPLFQDKALIQLLANLKIGKEIPEEAYHVVAEILAFVYRMAKY